MCIIVQFYFGVEKDLILYLIFCIDGIRLENLIRINFRYSGYNIINGINLIPFLFISRNSF